MHGYSHEDNGRRLEALEPSAYNNLVTKESEEEAKARWKAMTPKERETSARLRRERLWRDRARALSPGNPTRAHLMFVDAKRKGYWDHALQDH